MFGLLSSASLRYYLLFSWNISSALAEYFFSLLLQTLWNHITESLPKISWRHAAKFSSKCRFSLLLYYHHSPISSTRTHCHSSAHLLCIRDQTPSNKDGESIWLSICSAISTPLTSLLTEQSDWVLSLMYALEFHFVAHRSLIDDAWWCRNA